MAAPRVPPQLVPTSPRLEAALRFAAGPAAEGTLSARLSELCTRLAELCGSAIASVYALEAEDDLVLRGNHGFEPEALGEVRLKVGQGITGTAVACLRPVAVADAGAGAPFAYFPHLREERYPAFLAVPLLSGLLPVGALVLQRERGPFSAEEVLLAVAATPALVQQLAAGRPREANLLLRGEGHGRGRALGLAHLLSRALPRRGPPGRSGASPRVALRQLEGAFAAERMELRALAAKARAAAGPLPALEEAATLLEDGRLDERAAELLQGGLSPSLALERIAGEYARALAGAGPLARRALEAEAFLGAVARRLAGLEAPPVRKGELLVGVHLPALAALRGWASGAKGGLCAAPASESLGVALLNGLGLPVVAGVRGLFEAVHPHVRVALDADTGEVLVNPSATQAVHSRSRKG